VSETDDASERRHSKADEPELIKDPEERAHAEAANGLRQFDAGKAAAQEAIDRISSGDYRFRLRPSLIMGLHREALEGINRFAGAYRPGAVSITKSKHSPPPRFRVPELVEDMCDYVNENWDSKSALHLSAYVMWRLNWIHPFDDGNGRTSRISSYVVLMIRSGFILPGTPAIPDQIVLDRSGYFRALDEADAACREGRVDVSSMEELLGNMLAKQLAGFYTSAGGKLPPGVDMETR
jgi:Fic family protein